VINARGLIRPGVRDECRGRGPLPPAVGHVSDVGIFCVGVSLVGLEVSPQNDEVVWEGVCKLGLCVTSAGVVVHCLW